MANRYAVATGNWSDTATWDGGTLPTAGDVVRPNGFVVTIDQDVSGVTLMNNASAPAVAGGSFIVSGSGTRTLVLDIEQRQVGSLLRLTGSGIVNIIGAIDQRTIRSNNLATGAVHVESTCTMNHIGTASGGLNTVTYLQPTAAFLVTAAATCTFSGNYLGGTLGTGANYNPCILVSGNAVVSVSGTLTGGLAPKTAALHILSLTAVVTVNTITQANVSPAIWRDVEPYPDTLLIYGQIINYNGVNAIYSTSVKISNVSSITWTYQTNDALEDRTMYTADELTGYPLPAKVEANTVFGPSGEFEGTLLPWDATFAQALATAQRDLQLPSILSAITQP